MEINEERGNYPRAIECAKRLTKLDPNNGKLRAQLMGMEAKQVMDRGGYDDAKSTQHVRRNAYDDYRPATEKYVPDTVAGPGVSLEQDLRRAIRKTPTDKGNYIKLAEHFQKQKDFDKAADVLKEALDATGGDVNIREFYEDNDLVNLRHQIEKAKSIAADDEAGQKRIASLKRELLLREIEVYGSRTEALSERRPVQARAGQAPHADEGLSQGDPPAPAGDRRPAAGRPCRCSWRNHFSPKSSRNWHGRIWSGRAKS